MSERFIPWPERGHVIFWGDTRAPSIKVYEVPTASTLSDEDLSRLAEGIAESKQGLRVDLGSSHWPSELHFKKFLMQAVEAGLDVPECELARVGL
jgi:hypothetical protein